MSNSWEAESVLDLQQLWRPFRIFVLTTGHIGVLGRAGIFLFAAILFFRTVHTETNTGKSAFGNALAQLQDSRGGRAALFIMGAFTVCYGLFCTLSIYARIFPTPPPVSSACFLHDDGFSAWFCASCQQCCSDQIALSGNRPLHEITVTLPWQPACVCCSVTSEVLCCTLYSSKVDPCMRVFLSTSYMNFPEPPALSFVLKSCSHTAVWDQEGTQLRYGGWHP